MAGKMAAFLIILLTLSVGTLACDTNNLNSCLFDGAFDFFDLTHSFDQDSIYWPNSRRFDFIRKLADVRPDGSWYAANDFCAGEHGGTHLDAPYHFNPAGAKVGDITLDKLIIPLYVIDISSQVNDNPNFVLYKSNLDHMLNIFDTTKPCVLVFKFGWSKFYANPKKYLGFHGPNNDTLNFPGLSGEVAQFIASHRNVVGVGVDVASVDPGSSTDFPAHKILTQAGLYHMENVKLDQEIPSITCTALVMPMKIRQGTGAPLRLTAICPKQLPHSFSARDMK